MDVNRLSKIISHALRHDPISYNLTLDSNGWVDLYELETKLIHKGVKTTVKEIVDMVESATKVRHEIDNNRIRACYGHSIQINKERIPVLPPKILFHGTLQSNISNILKVGLLPMTRQFVHLSSNESEARIVASRRKGKVSIIKVNSYDAYLDGIKFYEEKNNIWLSDIIRPKYIIDND